MKKVFFIFFLSVCVLAQSEFLVNEYTDTTQRSPVIAKDSIGNYAVVWQSLNQVSSQSGYDIYLQKYFSNGTKNGSPQVVNQVTAGNQEYPVIAMNKSGKFVIAWTSMKGGTNLYDISYVVTTTGGTGATEGTANTTTAWSQNNPSVAISESGEFIIAWDSWYQDGSDRGVFAQRFDASGNKLGSEFQINQTTAYSQARPTVRYFSDGKILFIWESFKQDAGSPSGYGVYGRIFDATGNALTPEFRINSVTADYQWMGDAAIFHDNTFVVVWCSWEQDGDDGGIYFRRFDSSGSPLMNEQRVNYSSRYYQWLPKVKIISGNKFAVMWSSWKQDGDREGIFTALFDETNYKYTFETRVNVTTNSFQWEPDFIIMPNEEITAVWSSWKQFGSDYDIVTRRFVPLKPQGIVSPGSYLHPTGKSTAKILVHILDSTAVTGHTYKVSFDTASTADTVFATIRNTNTNVIAVNRFPVNRGTNVFYFTNQFDGVAVEFLPVFKLALDTEGSYFVNNSGSNLRFNVTPPTAGSKLLAPIDVALIWGSTDTLPGGGYVTPLDTALGVTGVRNVITPFIARNPDGGEKISLLVKENNATKNNRWDAGEDIVFITPPPYQVNPFNTHAQLTSIVPSGTTILPGVGDTNFVLTQRKITPQDTFYFSTQQQNILLHTGDETTLPVKPELYQNYPNPFNPTTIISFSVPEDGDLTIKIYDILGREVQVLSQGFRKAGRYSVIFDGSGIASGVYFYTLQAKDYTLTKKLLLLK